MIVEMIGGPNDGAFCEVPAGAKFVRVPRPGPVSLDGYPPAGPLVELVDLPIEIDVRTGKSFVRWRERS